MNTDTLKMKVLKLAVSFRMAPTSPEHKHVEVYSLIAFIGGRAAITYGMWAATSSKHRLKKSAFGYDVSNALIDYAANI
jgi:hypothetical protein